MTAPSDTFAAFVGVLSDALDDHEVTATDLAARVQLSRFHFDRVIAATAGESPARFRRRILLERAAFRLVTGDASILEIAVEAGYSSHEAFTRAFARAYGVPPKQWRREPTRIRLESPNGVHFRPPGSLRLPGREKVQPMDLLIRMVEHHVWLVDQMLDRAGQLDDARLDAPIEVSVEGVDDDPTLRSLLSRLVGQLDMWGSAIDNREYDFSVEQAESVLHMKQRLADVGPTFVAEVRDACDRGRLGDALLCPGESVEVYTFGGMVAHVLTFAAHRRTLAIGALYDASFTEPATRCTGSPSRPDPDGACDDGIDRTPDGRQRRALYAYAAEDAAWWATELGREIRRVAASSSRCWPRRSAAASSESPAVGESHRNKKRIHADVPTARIRMKKTPE